MSFHGMCPHALDIWYLSANGINAHSHRRFLAELVCPIFFSPSKRQSTSRREKWKKKKYRFEIKCFSYVQCEKRMELVVSFSHLFFSAELTAYKFKSKMHSRTKKKIVNAIAVLQTPINYPANLCALIFWAVIWNAEFTLTLPAFGSQ